MHSFFDVDFTSINFIAGVVVGLVAALAVCIVTDILP